LLSGLSLNNVAAGPDQIMRPSTMHKTLSAHRFACAKLCVTSIMVVDDFKLSKVRSTARVLARSRAEQGLF
jgi:hypothetical protein